MLSTLGRRINRGLPIQLTVLAFPFKVPNPAKVGARRLPDFAELAAIRHCCALGATIQDIYPPGLEIHILHDGLFIAEVFGIEREEVRQYETYFTTCLASFPNSPRCELRSPRRRTFIRSHEHRIVRHEGLSVGSLQVTLSHLRKRRTLSVQRRIAAHARARRQRPDASFTISHITQRVHAVSWGAAVDSFVLETGFSCGRDRLAGGRARRLINVHLCGEPTISAIPGRRRARQIKSGKPTNCSSRRVPRLRPRS